jgi:hypothetical protein
MATGRLTAWPCGCQYGRARFMPMVFRNTSHPIGGAVGELRTAQRKIGFAYPSREESSMPSACSATALRLLPFWFTTKMPASVQAFVNRFRSRLISTLDMRAMSVRSTLKLRAII